MKHALMDIGFMQH